MDSLESLTRVYQLIHTTIDHYSILVGRLMSETAAMAMGCDSVIARAAGAENSGSYAEIDTRIVSLGFGNKVDQAGEISETTLGREHPTTKHFRTTARKVAEVRNLVAHGNVATCDPLSGTITLTHSPRKSGYTESTITLVDLEDAIEDSKTVTNHATLLWSHLPCRATTRPDTRSHKPGRRRSA